MRGSLLVSLPLAVFIKRMKREMAVIAVTGSVYKCNPRYEIVSKAFKVK